MTEVKGNGGYRPKVVDAEAIKSKKDEYALVPQYMTNLEKMLDENKAMRQELKEREEKCKPAKISYELWTAIDGEEPISDKTFEASLENMLDHYHRLGEKKNIGPKKLEILERMKEAIEEKTKGTKRKNGESGETKRSSKTKIRKTEEEEKPKRKKSLGQKEFTCEVVPSLGTGSGGVSRLSLELKGTSGCTSLAIFWATDDGKNLDFKSDPLRMPYPSDGRVNVDLPPGKDNFYLFHIFETSPSKFAIVWTGCYDVTRLAGRLERKLPSQVMQKTIIYDRKQAKDEPADWYMTPTALYGEIFKLCGKEKAPRKLDDKHDSFCDIRDKIVGRA